MAPNNRLPSDIDFGKFLEIIDRNAELRGMRVVFYDGQELHVVREGPPMCAVGLKTVVIKPDLGENTVQSPAAAQMRESRLYSELLGAGLGCAGAVVGWVVVGGSAGAAPITGGASTFITYLAVGAATASSLACGNSLARVAGELYAPEAVDLFDSNGWYTSTVAALDAVSLLGVGASTAATIKMALAVRATTGKSMLEVLKGLSRQQRKRLAEEVVRAENPSISNSALKALVRAGKYPKRFSGLAVNQAIRNQLKDALGAALSFSGSAASGVVRQSAGYVAGLAYGFETY
jgi:hypothetical protein